MYRLVRVSDRSSDGVARLEERVIGTSVINRDKRKSRLFCPKIAIFNTIHKMSQIMGKSRFPFVPGHPPRGSQRVTRNDVSKKK